MNKILRIFPMLVLIGIVFSSFVILLMHFIRTDYDPISRYVSEYGIGKYGNLASLAFSVFGLAIIFLYPSLKKSLPKTKVSKIGELLIFIWGISMVVVGLFVSDPKLAQFTIHGTIHLIAAIIGFFSFVISSFLLFELFKKVKTFAGISKILQILSWISLVFLILFILGFVGDKSFAYNYSVPNFIKILSDFDGLTERIMLVASTMWAILVAYCLTRKIK